MSDQDEWDQAAGEAEARERAQASLDSLPTVEEMSQLEGETLEPRQVPEQGLHEVDGLQKSQVETSNTEANPQHEFNQPSPSSNSEPKPSGIDAGLVRLERRRAAKADARAAGDLKGQRARGWTEKLLTRTTSGAIYAIVTLVCLFWGILPTALLITAMAWLCCSEFFRMVRMAGRMPNEVFGLTAAVLFPLAPLFGTQGYEPSMLVLAVLLVACACWYVSTPRATIGDVALTVFGPVYTALAFSCMVMIRLGDPGFTGGLLAFGVMGSIWVEDAAAYFVGSRFGRHKLAPRISPNKSVEGLWGGLAGCLVVWLLLAGLHVMGITFPLAILCALVCGAAAVVGDLFESRIKRGVGVKDSGNVMPGHGGLLDRSDSMLFGSVVVYTLLHLGGIL